MGQGETYEEALACVKSMLKSHIAAFGADVFEKDDDEQAQQVFLAEAEVSL